MLARYRANRPGTPLPRMLLYTTIRRFVRVLFAVFYRALVIDAHKVPASGAILLVANHQSFLDPPLIGSTIYTRHIDFIARLGLFSSGAFGGLISALNALPIKEEGGDAAAIKEVLRRLDAGRAVLIFPEGSRSETGRMDHFKRGVAVLVKRSRCPVMPVAVEGCFDAWPRSEKRPRIRGMRVAVQYGDPIPHDELMAGSAEEGLRLLEQKVDQMRASLRDRLRAESRGRFPPAGEGDRPLSPAAG